MNDADYVIIVRLHDLEKSYVHDNKNCYHQTWAAGRLRGPNLVQINLKVTYNVMIPQLRDFDKTSQLRVNRGSANQMWIVQRAVP